MGQSGSKDLAAGGRKRRGQKIDASSVSAGRMSSCSSESDDVHPALVGRSRDASLRERSVSVRKGKFDRVLKYFRRASRRESTSSANTGTLSTVYTPDCYANPLGSRPQMKSLDELVLCTRFSREELQQMYRGFKNDCPTGFVDLEKFKRIYADLYPFGDSSSYARFIFNTFDSNKDGRITFEDFVVGLSKSMHGSLSERLKWSFHLYDLDNDGILTKEELVEVLDAVYRMFQLPVSANSPVLSVCICGDPAIEEQVEEIFEAMDTNGDGIVNEEEFVAGCLKDPAVLKSLAIVTNTDSLIDEIIYTDDEENDVVESFLPAKESPRKLSADALHAGVHGELSRQNSLPALKIPSKQANK